MPLSFLISPGVSKAEGSMRHSRPTTTGFRLWWYGTMLILISPVSLHLRICLPHHWTSSRSMLPKPSTPPTASKLLSASSSPTHSKSSTCAISRPHSLPSFGLHVIHRAVKTSATLDVLPLLTNEGTTPRAHQRTQRLPSPLFQGIPQATEWQAEA